LFVIVAPVSSSRLVAAVAAAWAGLAAWLSFGAIAFAGPGGARTGLVPIDPVHLVLACLAAVIALAVGVNARRASAVAAAVAPLLLIFLPWLPIPVPAAFLIWHGALSSLIWVAVALALVSVTTEAAGLTFYVRGRTRRAVLPGVIAAIIFSIAAWCVSPSLPDGDEPHYLVITQSLLYDHDLNIENNHRRGDYRSYFAGDLPPDSIRPARNGEIYSIHAPGVPALVLPAFALGGYHGVVLFLIVVASAASALAWWLAWQTTQDEAAAWFGWAVVTCSTPFLLESFTVYPDGIGAAIVLTGFWALQRALAERGSPDRIESGERLHDAWNSAPPSSGNSALPWFLHGLALALLPWMHTRFAVLAATLGGLILVRLARTPNAMTKAIAFLAPSAASAVAWLFFFAIVYGTPDPSAPYGGRLENSFAFLPDGLGGLLFDQGFGLIAIAPVFAAAFFGFGKNRRFALEWLIVILPYLLAVTTFAMWWAGRSGPARFVVPLLLPLAIPAASAWAGTKSRAGHVVMLAALVVSVWLSAVIAGGDGGRLAYHTRNEGGMTGAPWMQWGNHVVDLPSAFPAFVPLPGGTGLSARQIAAQSGFATTVPWVLSIGFAAFFVVWAVDRRDWLPRERVVSLTVLTFAGAVMVAASVVWKMHTVDPVTTVPAQINALSVLASGRVAAFDLTGRRRLPLADAWAMRLEVPVIRRSGGRRSPLPLNRPVAVFPSVPAGAYVVSVRRHVASGGNEGWVMVGVGNDQFAIATGAIAAFDAGVRIDLPVSVRTLTVRADEVARDQLDAIELRAASAVRPLSNVAAWRAVRYDTTVAFFLDERAWPEPGGFWVGGAREAMVALHSDTSRPSIALALRNGAADNVVTLEVGKWHETIALNPGEERQVAVPTDPSTGAVALRIQSASGFRPSETDAKSRDTRYLGAYVRILEF
jgi:hypothetical protein